MLAIRENKEGEQEMNCVRCGSCLHDYDHCPDVENDKRVAEHNEEFQHRLKVEGELERIRKALEATNDKTDKD